MSSDDTKDLPPPYPEEVKFKTDEAHQQRIPQSFQPIADAEAAAPCLQAQTPIYNHTTIIQPMTATLNYNPVTMICPHCQQQIVTSIRHQSSGVTCLLAAVICFVGGFCGCCLIPFFSSSFKDTIHTCPRCYRFIGRRKFL